MFTYSLSGLALTAPPGGSEEVEENETTSRSAVYQVFGAFFGPIDRDHYDKAREGMWAKELAKAGALLPFEFVVGEATLAPEVGPDGYATERSRLLGEDAQSRLIEGQHAGDCQALEVALRRDYEYYGLSVSDDGSRPPGHLVTECDFMQYLSFREAATGSDRLRTSYRRAQRDFLEQHLARWAPAMVETVLALDPRLPFSWGLTHLDAFLRADHDYVMALLG